MQNLHAFDDDMGAIHDYYRTEIEHLRPAAEAGDGAALLEASVLAMYIDAPLPNWIVAELGDAIQRYTAMEVRTLDEAFGLRPRTQSQFRKDRVALQFGTRIFYQVCALHSAGLPITKDLFQRVGALHRIGWNKAARCYSTELKRRGGQRWDRITHPDMLNAELRTIFDGLAVPGKQQK